MSLFLDNKTVLKHLIHFCFLNLHKAKNLTYTWILKGKTTIFFLLCLITLILIKLKESKKGQHLSNVL